MTSSKNDWILLINAVNECPDKYWAIIYETKWGRTFTENVITDFVQFSCAIAKSLFLEGRLGTRFYLHPTLRFPKSRQLVRQLVHSASDDNNLASFHLRWTETMPKHKKSQILVGIHKAVKVN